MSSSSLYVFPIMNIRLPPRERPLCRFYLQGMCRFGTMCWNLHASAVTTRPVEPENEVMQREGTVCWYNLQGMCRFGTTCRNLHVATVTTRPVEPENEESTSTSSTAAALGACAVSPRKSTALESDKENTFGSSTSSVDEDGAGALVKIAQSEDKTCGICLDTIVKKLDRTEQYFGILPNCNHCFCFTCIMRWRQTKEFGLEVAKTCPVCRITSDFVCRSKFWVENTEEKDELIESYKQKLKETDCKYFRKGKGKCPRGNTCPYQHALPNGQTIDVGPPGRRRLTGLENGFEQMLFWLNYCGLGEEGDEINFFDSDSDYDYAL